MKIVLAIDLETTGLPRDRSIEDPDYPRMVQIGGVLFTSDDKTHGRIQNYVEQPDKRTSKSAEKIHGITDRLSRTMGVSEMLAVKWFTNQLSAADMVVGWSLGFDLDIMRAALIRMKQDPSALIPPGKVKVDLQELLTPEVGLKTEDGSQKWPSLAEGYRHVFGRELYDEGKTHDAGTDAEACRQIFVELWKQGKIENLEQAA